MNGCIEVILVTMPNSNYNITSNTTPALGEALSSKIYDQNFCIIGCGAVGSIFAELLVRTGARRFTLIDSDTVKQNNLNKAFVKSDLNQSKVDALSERLLCINPSIPTPVVHKIPFGASDADECQKSLRELIARSVHFVLIAADNNIARIACEEFLSQHDDINYMSIGLTIHPIDTETNQTKCIYECVWRPFTNRKYIDEEGYGPGNVSFASIVMEATAVGFNLMLHNLKNPNQIKSKIFKEYGDIAIEL